MNNYKKYFLIFILGLFTQACNKQVAPVKLTESPLNETDVSERIANGSLVTSSAFLGSIVKLQILDQSGNQYICSGTFITKQVILSAAHCLSINGHVAGTANVEVFFGQSTSAVSLGHPQEVIVHENYNSANHTSDLSLLIMPTMNNSYLKTINSFVNPSKISKGSKLAVLGFGRTDVSNGAIDKLYMNANIEFSDNHPASVFSLEIDPDYGSDSPIYTWKRYSLLNSKITGNGFFTTKEWVSDSAVIDYNHITDAKPSGSCSGDSGGPTLIYTNGKYSLVGVTSFGFSPFINNCGGTTFYTSIYDFQNWIRSHLPR